MDAIDHMWSGSQLNITLYIYLVLWGSEDQKGSFHPHDPNDGSLPLLYLLFIKNLLWGILSQSLNVIKWEDFIWARICVLISSWIFGVYWNVFTIILDMSMGNILSITIMFQDSLNHKQCKIYLSILWKFIKFNKKHSPFSEVMMKNHPGRETLHDWG